MQTFLGLLILVICGIVWPPLFLIAGVILGLVLVAARTP